MRAVSAAAVETSEVALHALSALGAPYAEGGRSPETGFDCSGLVAYAYWRASRLALPRTTLELSRIGRHVAAPDLQPGDLLFFDTQRRAYSHVGIYLGEQRFIHAPSAGGAVRIDDLRLDYWLRRFNGARRLAL
ncbi:MAG: C40 family peptidase [Burkholderiales bacterium]|nr:C40 family peptidase [Burkholderiales bacterium]